MRPSPHDSRIPIETDDRIENENEKKTGGPPNGKFALTSENHEQHFAVQCLSRFGLPFLLARSGTLKSAVVSVCAPGQGGDVSPDLEDLDLIKAKEAGKYGLFAAGKRDSSVVDGFTAVSTCSSSLPQSVIN